MNKASEFSFDLAFFKLQVTDIEKAKRFYELCFGMEEVQRIEITDFLEILLRMPGSAFTLVLFHDKDGRSYEHGSSYDPLGFTTRDIEGAIGHIIAHGGKLIQEPAVLTDFPFAFVADPEGHLIELLQIDGTVASVISAD